MGYHTFDPAATDRLADPTRFRFCSREELLESLPTGPDSLVLDIGSGSGFYTDEIAPFVGQLCGLDVQPEMHRQYADRGVPANVSLVTADAGQVPFSDGTFDASVSTMTFHESASEPSLAELARVIDAGGRAVFVDWSRAGRGRLVASGAGRGWPAGRRTVRRRHRCCNALRCRFQCRDCQRTFRDVQTRRRTIGVEILCDHTHYSH